MLQRSVLITVLCVIMAGACVWLVGCPAKPDSSEMADSGLMEPTAMPEDNATTEFTDFEWTDAPTVAMIPSGRIHGMMNDKPFEAQTVRIEKVEDGKFELNISNMVVEGDDPTSSISGDDAWQLTFSAEEGAPGEWTWKVDDTKDFNKEHVYYRYQQGEDRSPMNVNRAWGAALEITDWIVSDPPEDANTSQTILGTVKGKVLLVMRSDTDDWIGGEFDAVYYER